MNWIVLKLLNKIRQKKNLLTYLLQIGHVLISICRIWNEIKKKWKKREYIQWTYNILYI